MRAIQVTALTGPADVQLVDVDEPAVSADQLIIDVESSQRNYGRLAAFYDDHGFFAHEHRLLSAYARSAAAALDAATGDVTSARSFGASGVPPDDMVSLPGGGFAYQAADGSLLHSGDGWAGYQSPALTDLVGRAHATGAGSGGARATLAFGTLARTGGIANATYAGSYDEMFTKFQSGGGGQYDLVSPSGDASLRLIKSGAVAPLDTVVVTDAPWVAT